MIDQLPRAEKIEMLMLMDLKELRVNQNKIVTYFKYDGPLRRELYPKHLEFFAAGKNSMERLALAANRIGKTEGMGGYETSLHLSWDYPPWWNGRRFNRPISAWVAGKSTKTTRDILQEKLIGPKDSIGTGVIPANRNM